MAKRFFGKEKKEVKDLTKEREDTLRPVAKMIIKLISEGNLAIGQTHAHDNAAYDAVAKEVLVEMLKNGVKYVDKDFLFQLVLQPFDIVKETVMRSLSASFDKSLEKSFGKDFRELTLIDMDNMLKKDVK